MNEAPRRRPIANTRARNGAWLVLSAILLSHAHAYAQSGPQPPCGSAPVPAYPGVEDSAAAKSWSKSEAGNDWRPPSCTGWTALGFTTLVTTTARFRSTSEAEALLRQFGAISKLAGMRYWSTTHKRWQTLIVDAYALTGSQPAQRRADFAPDEMTEGKTFYFEQADNISGKGIYRMHIARASEDRIVIDIENASPLHYLLIPLFRPGDLETIYFLDRESEDTWRYYSIVRIGKDVSKIAGNESSAINRAAAFYRHLAGIPADQEPPAAR